MNLLQVVANRKISGLIREALGEQVRGAPVVRLSKNTVGRTE